MIPIPVTPRLYAELALVVLLIVASGSAVAYRALYKASKTEVSEQLSRVAAETAQATADEWSKAYAALEAQRAKDLERGRKAARDAAARAAKAEAALNQMRRSRHAEASTNPCIDQPLSPTTVDRLRQLEDSYRPGAAAAD